MDNEILDVIDEHDNLIGKDTRKTIHEVGWWHRGVHVLLFDQDGKLLIQRRSANRTSNPLRLDGSVSEHVLSGEDFLQGAIRGMKEEIGLENIEIKKLAKFRMNYGINDNEISELYEGVIASEQVKFDLEEIESISYISMEELKQKVEEDQSQFCDWFVELLKLYWGQKGKMEILEKLTK